MNSAAADCSPEDVSAAGAPSGFSSAFLSFFSLANLAFSAFSLSLRKSSF
jgi:hypothetical protein